jgi:hypothetical protein
VRSRYIVDTVAPVTCLTLLGRGSGTWATLLALRRVHDLPVATFFAVVVRAHRSEEAGRACGVGVGGTALQGGAGVLDGATVIDVARRNGVVRQTVHDWLRRYVTWSGRSR